MATVISTPATGRSGRRRRTARRRSRSRTSRVAGTATIDGRQKTPGDNLRGFLVLCVLVAVVIRLVRPFDGHADVRGLLLGELRETRAELLQVKSGDLLVEVFR